MQGTKGTTNTGDSGDGDDQSRGGGARRGGGQEGGDGGSGGSGGDGAWKRGMRVQLEGLAARPELNGSLGVLLGPMDSESGRVPVKLVEPEAQAGKTMKVKAANLRRT